jgi:hypothetical protein
MKRSELESSEVKPSAIKEEEWKRVSMKRSIDVVRDEK